jgi:hypothetical protein
MLASDANGYLVYIISRAGGCGRRANARRGGFLNGEIMPENVYEDRYFMVISPSRPLNCRDDGGHSNPRSRKY